jgi:hypothetical protein
MPQAPQEWVFAGLNLLRLLLANRIAEFHTELELIPDQVIKNCLCFVRLNTDAAYNGAVDCSMSGGQQEI